MRSKDDILKMLNSLENYIADDFEAQDLDFKEWIERSINDNINIAVKMAVCMANSLKTHEGIRDKWS